MGLVRDVPGVVERDESCERPQGGREDGGETPGLHQREKQDDEAGEDQGQNAVAVDTVGRHGEGTGGGLDPREEGAQGQGRGADEDQYRDVDGPRSRGWLRSRSGGGQEPGRQRDSRVAGWRGWAQRIG